MRKTVLCGMGLLAAAGLSAQTVLFEDDFEGYPDGGYISLLSDTWETWTGVSAEDAFVTTVQANSGNNSMEITAATPTDIVLPVGPYTTGKYDVEWKMYIPQGQGGYFNLLHDWAVDDTNYEWAVDVFFSSTGDITWIAGGADGGGETFPIAAWFDVKVAADMDNDMGYLYIEGNLIHSWQWSLNNANGAAGQNRLAAVDFFGTQPTGSGPGLYYVDDVVLTETTGVGIVEQADLTQVSIAPNPAIDYVDIASGDGLTPIQVSVMNLTGQQVSAFTLEPNGKQRVDVSELQSGLYLVRLESGDQARIERLIVR